MDLGGWNFDSSFMNSINWAENGSDGTARNDADKEKKTLGDTIRATSSDRSSPSRLDANSWDGHLALLSSFGGIEYEGGSSKPDSENNETSSLSQSQSQSQSQNVTNCNEEMSVSPSKAARPASVSDAASSASTKAIGASSVSTGTGTTTTTSTQQQSQSQSQSQDFGESRMHPMAIQSSATCPPHSGSITGAATMPSTPYNQLAAAGLIPTQHQPPANMFGLSAAEGAAAQASFSRSYGGPMSTTSTTNDSDHLKSLAANFMMARNGTTDEALRMYTTASATSGHNINNNNNNYMSTAPSKKKQGKSRNTTTTTTASLQSGSLASSSSAAAGAATKSRPHHHHHSATSTSTTASTATGASASKAPPFYLFDAPVELRANFMQNQRRLGLPIQHDPNSYHYGETVKGFHPQQLLNQQQAMTLRAKGLPSQIPPAPVQLIDARHNGNRRNPSGRVKNEREQKRAQKITELIEQLRINMEQGGWKVEMRSKFYTLSQCAEYVKHMIKTTKEKEDEVKKLKSDLEVKQRKAEEDKAAQESRSDPESVTSSLTSDTTGSHSHLKSESSENNGHSIQKTDKADSSSKDSPRSNNMRNQMSSISANEDSSGGGEDQGSGGSGSGEPSSRAGVSTLSDLTESNRASSSNNSGSTSGTGSGSGKPDSTSRLSANDADDEARPSTSSISSDAAVASEKSSHDRHRHKDVVWNVKRSDRKRPPEEVTSLERSFELNYEEVFAMSNIPQLIATTSGKIVAWNQFFLRVTGLRKADVSRMTIFSMVRREKLIDFFEIAAQALKLQADEDNTSSESAGSANGSDVHNNGESDVNSGEDTAAKGDEQKSDKPSETADASRKTREVDYAAITLPCIDFPAMKRRREETDGQHDAPLQVTINLLGGTDPTKRSFHCVFTDQPGKDGALGSISADLLKEIYAENENPHKKLKRHHHHHHSHRRKKRPLISEEGKAVTEIQTHGEIREPESENERPSKKPTPSKVEETSSKSSSGNVGLDGEDSLVEMLP